MPGVVEDVGGCPGGYWGLLLARFFEGGAEGEGRGFVSGAKGEGWWLHANKAWRCFFLVMDAGDGGGWGLVGLVDRTIG